MLPGVQNKRQTNRVWAIWTLNLKNGKLNKPPFLPKLAYLRYFAIVLLHEYSLFKPVIPLLVPTHTAHPFGLGWMG